MKKFINFFIALGIVTAFIPAFLFYFQKTYYEARFSLMTSSLTCIFFPQLPFYILLSARKINRIQAAQGLLL